RQLVYILHPQALMKGETARLNILMIRANKPETFVFDNGTIVITTGQIAKTNSEEELLSLLALQTAHIVLDHNLMNLNQEVHSQRSAEFWSTFAILASAVAMEFSNIKYGTNFYAGDVVLAGLTSVAISDAIMLSAGSKFDEEQIQKAERLSREFIANLEQDEGFDYLPDKEYMINISSILSFTAWQEYHHHNYDRSMFYMDRIFNLGIANEEDYLLRAKLKRTLSNSYESNLEALQLINTALAMNDFNYVEALAEKGLILIRLDQVGQAREVFEEYKAAVAGMSNMPQGRDATWANRMLIKCDQLMLRR
ncbi:M48 family metalloprotease, partial [Bacteroidota bacterium]